MNNIDVVEKIKKLLKLSRSENANEAAVAAARAAELMAKYAIEEASIRLDDSGRAAEPITEEVVEKSKKRVAWKGCIASGLAQAFGAKMFWMGGDITLFGRKSALQAIGYMHQYLTREVERLADEAWEEHMKEVRAKGITYYVQGTRTWKNGFRLGAASTIQNRLYQQRSSEITKRREEKKAAQAAMEEAYEPKSEEVAVACGDASAPTRALACIDVVEQDEAEVSEAYTKRSKGFGTVRGSRTRAVSAYGAGQKAGASINLNGGRGLSAPSPKLRG